MFTNKFFDSYIKTGKIKRRVTKQMWFFNYCLSVNWRVLYDDIYNEHSFEGDYPYDGFVDYEAQLSGYLNNLKNGLECNTSQFENYVFKISELTQDGSIIKLFESLLYGYCIYNPTYYFYLTCTYYKGLLFVTEFIDKKVIYISTIKDIWSRKHRRRYLMREIFAEDIIEQARLAAQQYNENITNKLKMDIKNRYYSE